MLAGRLGVEAVTDFTLTDSAASVVGNRSEFNTVFAWACCSIEGEGWPSVSFS